tara:strand:+ start:306 stop:689 length:384 start_codon:yes stop_codon:yes gene_type:complete
MEKITTIDDLNLSTLVLQKAQAEQKIMLKEEFNATFESIKPANLIKSTFQDLVSTPDLKNNILDTSMSVAAGFLSKKLAIGASSSKFKQFFGSLLQLGVTKVFSENAAVLKYKLGDTADYLYRKLKR